MMTMLKKHAKAIVRKMLTRLDESNNETGWDRYATRWDQNYGNEFDNLGDEWTGEIKSAADRSSFLTDLENIVIRPFMEGGVDTLVEIGPGGGRATQILLKYCRKELIACDVAQKMLDLIRRRFSGESKIQCMKLTVGKGLSELQARNVDVVFSFDVFVHIDPHDIYEYVRTFNAVLRPGGIGIIHHSVIETDRGWLRFLDDHPYCMNARKPYCAFSVMTGEIMKIFAERAGFQVIQQIGAFRPETGSSHAMVTVFKKPLAS